MTDLPLTIYKGVPVADSRDVGDLVGKRHDQLMRNIRTYIKHLSGESGSAKLQSETSSGSPKLGSENALLLENSGIKPSDFFMASHYTDERGKIYPCYCYTEKGCDMIANKMTGQRGTIFTALYVSKFRAMEKLIAEMATPLWQDTRAGGKEARKAEGEVIARFIGYARSQGSRNADRYYTNLSRLANEAAGITDRNQAHGRALALLQLAETVIAAALREGMAAGLPYKDVFRQARERVQSLVSIPGLKGA